MTNDNLINLSKSSTNPESTAAFRKKYCSFIVQPFGWAITMSALEKYRCHTWWPSRTWFKKDLRVYSSKYWKKCRYTCSTLNPAGSPDSQIRDDNSGWLTFRGADPYHPMGDSAFPSCGWGEHEAWTPLPESICTHLLTLQRQDQVPRHHMRRACPNLSVNRGW